MSPGHDRDLETATRNRHGGPEFSPVREGEAVPGPGLGLDARPDPGARPAAWVAVTGAGRHGGHPVLRGSVARLQTSAGNAAVAGLLTAPGDVRATRRVSPTLRHAGDTDAPRGTSGSDSPRGVAEPAEGATPLDDEEMPPPTSSFTRITPPSMSSYTVSGTLRQAAEAVGARDEAGAEKATPDLVAADNGTRMVHAQVTVGIGVVLPEWDGKASATPNQRAEWDRFKAAITAHEAAHVEIDKTSFANAHAKILSKKTLAESYEQYDTIIAQAKAANDAFDGDAHGRPATNINPNIGEVTKVP
jgi:hypothetical protein